MSLSKNVSFLCMICFYKNTAVPSFTQRTRKQKAGVLKNQQPVSGAKQLPVRMVRMKMRTMNLQKVVERPIKRKQPRQMRKIVMMIFHRGDVPGTGEEEKYARVGEMGKMRSPAEKAGKVGTKRRMVRGKEKTRKMTKTATKMKRRKRIVGMLTCTLTSLTARDTHTKRSLYVRQNFPETPIIS